MTKRPEVTAENYQQVYSYYRDLPQHPHVNAAIMRLESMVYSPDVLLTDEVREHIDTQLALGKGALMALNHPTYHDPFTAAAAVQRAHMPQLGDCMTFAMDGLFHGVKRPFIDSTGSVPVFRRKSYPDLPEEIFADATTQLLDLAAHRLQQGSNVLIFPQGGMATPEAMTQLKLHDIKTGIARIALQATSEHSFIIPMAVVHRSNNRKRVLPPRHSVFAIGEPITEYAETVDGIRRQIRSSMQQQLSRALLVQYD